MQKYLCQISATPYSILQARVQVRSLQRAAPERLRDYVLVVEAMQGVSGDAQRLLGQLSADFPDIDIYTLPNHENGNNLHSFLSDRKVHRGYMARFSAYTYLLDTYGEDLDFIFLDPDMFLFKDLFLTWPVNGLYRHDLGGLDLYETGGYSIPVPLVALGSQFTGLSEDAFREAYTRLGGTTPYRFNSEVLGDLRGFLRRAERTVVWLHDALMLSANARYQPNFGAQNAKKFTDDGVGYLGYISEMAAYVMAFLTCAEGTFAVFDDGQEAVPALDKGKTGQTVFCHLAGFPVYGGYTKSNMFSSEDDLRRTLAAAPTMLQEARERLGDASIHTKFWDLMVHLED